MLRGEVMRKGFLALAVCLVALASLPAVAVAAPYVHYVKLNDESVWGSKWTNSTTVILNWWVDDATSAMIWTDAASGSWQACSSEDSGFATIGSANGKKTVYGQFRDDNGSTSDVVQRTITLDRTRPRVRSLVRAGASVFIKMEVRASDNLSPSFQAEMKILTLKKKLVGDEGSGFKWWSIKKSVTIDCFPKPGTYRVGVRVNDHAGNFSKWVWRTIKVTRM